MTTLELMTFARTLLDCLAASHPAPVDQFTLVSLVPSPTGHNLAGHWALEQLEDLGLAARHDGNSWVATAEGLAA